MKTPPTPNDADSALRALEAQRVEATAKADTAAQLAATETLRADTAEGRIAVLEAQIVELRTLIAAGATAAESEAIQREAARADAAESRIVDFDRVFAGRVAERVSLERKATVVMGDEFRMDGLTDREVMATVVKRLDSSADISDSVAEGIIRGRFLASTERHGRHAQSLARVAEVSASTSRQDAAEAKKIAQRDAWRQPLPNARKDR